MYKNGTADVSLGVETPNALIGELSPREIQIARLVAAGLTNGQICERLQLKPQTVKNRISQIFDKTGVRNRAELAMLVQRNGLE